MTLYYRPSRKITSFVRINVGEVACTAPEESVIIFTSPENEGKRSVIYVLLSRGTITYKTNNRTSYALSSILLHMGYVSIEYLTTIKECNLERMREKIAINDLIYSKDILKSQLPDDITQLIALFKKKYGLYVIGTHSTMGLVPIYEHNTKTNELHKITMIPEPISTNAIKIRNNIYIIDYNTDNNTFYYYRFDPTTHSVVPRGGKEIRRPIHRNELMAVSVDKFAVMAPKHSRDNNTVIYVIDVSNDHTFSGIAPFSIEYMFVHGDRVLLLAIDGKFYMITGPYLEKIEGDTKNIELNVSNVNISLPDTLQKDSVDSIISNGKYIVVLMKYNNNTGDTVIYSYNFETKAWIQKEFRGSRFSHLRVDEEGFITPSRGEIYLFRGFIEEHPSIKGIDVAKTALVDPKTLTITPLKIVKIYPNGFTMETRE